MKIRIVTILAVAALAANAQTWQITGTGPAKTTSTRTQGEAVTTWASTSHDNVPRNAAEVDLRKCGALASGLVGATPSGGTPIKIGEETVYHVSTGKKTGNAKCTSCCTVFYTADRTGAKGEIVGIGSHKTGDSYNMEYVKTGWNVGKVYSLR